jgi:hypothetical protein
LLGMLIRRTLWVAAGLLCFAMPRETDAESLLCTPIVAVPFTITQAGNYCLEDNLSLNATSGSAISVQADFVTIDLNGFKLDGSGGGGATTAYGISATSRKSIIVRDGSIRGFGVGVYLNGATSADHLIEGIRAFDNKTAAIWVEGKGTTVQNNYVANTSPGSGDSRGILVGAFLGATGVRVLNNDVRDTSATSSANATAILVSYSDGAVIDNNRVINSTLATNAGAITVYANASGKSLVVNNKISNFTNGVNFLLTGGKYRDNLTTNVTNPYLGGEDAGNNN